MLRWRFFFFFFSAWFSIERLGTRTLRSNDKDLEMHD